MTQDNNTCVANPKFVNDQMQYGNAPCAKYSPPFPKQQKWAPGCAGICWKSSSSGLRENVKSDSICRIQQTSGAECEMPTTPPTTCGIIYLDSMKICSKLNNEDDCNKYNSNIV